MNLKELIKDKDNISRTNITLVNVSGNFNSYKIKTSELFLNPYNDRFAKEILEWERKQHKALGLDSESQIFLYELLLLINDNKKTEKDIIKNGLIRNIVVDINGIVIDGNRRVSILRKLLSYNKKEILKRFEYIDVVVVPYELNKAEISEMETKLQISEDEKVEYDLINMYLKVEKHLKSIPNNIDKKNKFKYVADLLGSKYTAAKIKEMQNTFSEMKIYLSDFLCKPKEYKLLDQKTDQFIHILKFNNKFNNKKISFDFAQNYPKFKKIKEILYVFASLGLRANPQFRDLVPGEIAAKSPLSREKGIKKIDNFLNENNLYEWAQNKPNVKHNLFDSDYLQSMIVKITNELNNKTPEIKYKNKITKIELNLSEIYNSINNGELSNLSNETIKSINNSFKYLEWIMNKVGK